METAGTFISVAVLILGIISTVDAAGATEGARSLTMQCADLDRSKIEGAVALFHPIKRAARKACEIPRLPSLDVEPVRKHVAFSPAEAIAGESR